jgi:putative ABC transport system permease protein
VFGVGRMAPWVRAPFLLARRPGVAAALVAASFVAVLPAAAAVPFLSSSANATLHSQIAATCPASVGDVITYDMHMYGADDYNQRWTSVPGPSVAAAAATDQKIEVAVARMAATDPALAAPRVVWYAQSAAAHVAGQSVRVTSMAMADLRRNVHVLSGGTGPGIWVPDGFAAAYHVRVGQKIKFTSPWAAPTTLAVAAIYVDPRNDPNNPAFCGVHDLIFGPRGAQLADNAVPPVVLMDRTTFLSGVIPYRSKASIAISIADPRLPYDRTAGAIATIDRINARMPALMGPCPGCQSASSQLAAFATRARLARSGITPTVVPITAAGVLVGLVVVGAAAVFWVLRRRRELTVLSAHGMGAASLGVKAILEALPALLTGSALAWVGAWWLVRSAGPDPIIARAAIADSLWTSVAALVAVIVVVGIAAAMRARSLTDERRARHRFRAASLPWELLIIAAAVWAAVSFGSATVTRDTPGGDGGLVVQVPPKLLIVPLLISVGGLMLVGRLVVLALRGRWSNNGHAGTDADRDRPAEARGPTRRTRSMVWYLGWRRVAREAAMVAVLGGATAVPIALATYGDAVTRSVQATVEGEAKLLVGTDVVVTLRQRVPVPPAFGPSATEVLRVTGVSIGGVDLDLYAVDPAAFARVAFWNDQIDGQSLDSVLAPLRETPGLDNVYGAVTSGSVPTGVQAPTWGFATTTQYDLTRVETLPAEQGGYRSLIVTPESLGTEAAAATPQLWIRGDPARIRATLATLHLPIASVSSVDAVYSNTVFQPLTYTFQYLTALSILTGVVTIVGLLLYVEARAPGHRRGYVIARRMGLRRATHRNALLVELAAPLIAGLGLGLAIAVSLTYAFSSGFDVDPTLPPHTLVALPALVMSGIGVAVAAVAVAASGFAQFRIGRANPSEVLRDTL